MQQCVGSAVHPLMLNIHCEAEVRGSLYWSSCSVSSRWCHSVLRLGSSLHPDWWLQLCLILRLRLRLRLRSNHAYSFGPEFQWCVSVPACVPVMRSSYAFPFWPAFQSCVSFWPAFKFRPAFKSCVPSWTEFQLRLIDCAKLVSYKSSRFSSIWLCWNSSSFLAAFVTLWRIYWHFLSVFYWFLTGMLYVNLLLWLCNTVFLFVFDTWPRICYQWLCALNSEYEFN